MAKKVTVLLKNGEKEEYQNVSRVEEDRDYDKVTAIRLYQGSELRAVINYGLIQRLEVLDQT